MIDSEMSYKNKRGFNIKDILAKIVFILVVFAFGIWVGQSVSLPFNQDSPLSIKLSNNQTPEEIKVDFAPFWDVWSRITADYLERNKIDPQKLLYGAISGMVKAVGDPYTVFLDPENNKEFELSLAGSYEGVGIEIAVRDEKLVVVAPIGGTPADKAGVRAGDFILGIDGQDTFDMTVQDAVQKIRGEKGKSVKLTLQREKKVFEVAITRDQIVLKSVEFKAFEGGTAHLKITRFGDNTVTEWNKEVGKVMSQGYKKIILDMRNNPGGRLDQAITIAGDFVPAGSPILLEEDASGKKTPFKSENQPRLSGYKVVILINKGSASASEIVAGALRDLNSVKIVGETSFGKGTVQRVDDLPDGSGLHITFAKWLTPSGTWVHDKGLKPDVEVKLTEDDIKNNKDPQFDKAKSLLQ